MVHSCSRNRCAERSLDLVGGQSYPPLHSNGHRIAPAATATGWTRCGLNLVIGPLSSALTIDVQAMPGRDESNLVATPSSTLSIRTELQPQAHAIRRTWIVAHPTPFSRSDRGAVRWSLQRRGREWSQMASPLIPTAHSHAHQSLIDAHTGCRCGSSKSTLEKFRGFFFSGRETSDV